MAITSGFFNAQVDEFGVADRLYDAEQMSSIFDGIIRDGVFAFIGDKFNVTIGGGNAVNIGTGRAWFDHVWILNDAVYPLVTPATEVALDRIDVVVFDIDRDIGVRNGSISVIKGIPSSAPSRPAMIREEERNTYPIAYIRRRAGRSLTQADITVVVGTGETPFVTGPLETIGVDLFVGSMYDDWLTWFDSVKDILNDTPVGNLINRVMDLETDVGSLTDEIDNITPRLAQTENLMNRELLSKKERKPMMTFIDDDGRSPFKDKWTSIIQEKNVPVTSCLITSKVGTPEFMTWEEIEALRKLGVEFISHTHTHPQLTTIAEEEVHYEFKTSNDILKSRGLQPNVLVYPGGYTDATVRRIARDYYRCAIDIDSMVDNINFSPIHTYQLKRVSLGGEYNNTLAHYKSKIDEIVANNGWLIWMSHSQYPSFDETQLQYVREIIDYARSQGVEITNVNGGMDYFGNAIDAGDFSQVGADYTVLDNQGVLHSKSVERHFSIVRDTNINFNTPLTYFKSDTVTRIDIDGTVSAGFPRNLEGILETHSGKSTGFGFQLYYLYDRNEVYKRFWTAQTGIWNDFEKVSVTPTEIDALQQHNVANVNSYTSSDLITAFPMNQITTVAVNGGNASEVPVAEAGILTVYRITTDSFSHQEYRPYRRSEIWSRFPNSDGTWSEWVKVSGS